MWLDRLAGVQSGTAGSTSSQPVSRPYSPSPVRPSNLLSPYVTSHQSKNQSGDSSVSLVSNESTESLLSSRKLNGTTQQSAALADTSGALEVLSVLLGEGTGHVKLRGRTKIISVEDLEVNVDFAGLSLKDFASSPDNDETRGKLEDLHRSISACDEVLHSVERNLASFQNDLAAVSADIETLQQRSTELNRRLENRLEVERALGPLVESISISPDVITKITTGRIDESWVKTLIDVDRRAATLGDPHSATAPQNKAAQELQSLLQKLILKAVERIRSFLVAQIKALRSPHINAQVIQQRHFLQFKDLFAFLHKHHETLSNEISQAYMNTMRWYYSTQFSRYEKALRTMKLRTLGASHELFTIRRRIDVLKTTDHSALPSFLAENQTPHFVEIPFRNFNLALIDNAVAEYTFLLSFFDPVVSSARTLKNFNYVFESTFELGRSLTKSLVGETFDALGLLLCIRLNQHLAFELQRRRVPAVDGYINATNMLLWPRLQVIMDRHCDSLRQLTTATPANPPTRPSGDPSKITAAPHVVTQHYGQFLHSILSLSADAGDDEPVAASLRRLRSELEDFLNRFSLAYGKDKRKSARFLYNNYSLILTIIGDMPGKLAIAHQEHFTKLKLVHQDGP